MKTVYLSFDIEEFDMPFEYGVDISFHDQIKISADGTTIILDLLKKHNVKATFFSTVVFAQNFSSGIARIVNDGHELASHGYYHSSFEPMHLLQSRLALEKIAGTNVTGFRMPRMKKVDDALITKAGYKYDSSLNPIYLPGRYNNFFKPRTIFKSAELTKIPASATPFLRIPLFWLSFHNFPLSVYKACCTQTMNSDQYLNIYFHPWEFRDLSAFGFPAYVTKNSGEEMAKRLEALLLWMKARKYTFSRLDAAL